MLNKKFFTFISTLLAMSLLVGCGGGHIRRSSNTSSISSTSISTSTNTSTNTSSGGSTNSSGQESSSESTGSSEDISSSSSTIDATFIVTFYNNGAVYGEPIYVNYGDVVERPAVDPTRPKNGSISYVFDNWYERYAVEPYDFSTPVTDDLELYSQFKEEYSSDYDLVVYILGGAYDPDNNPYITEDESIRVLTEFRQFEGVNAEANISWNTIYNHNVASFCALVNSSETPVDVVIGGTNLDSNGITYDLEYGKTRIGSGWFRNTSRYVGILSTCIPSHRELAGKLYDMLIDVGPEYGIKLSNASLALEIGEEFTLSATYYGPILNYELQEVDPVGCVTLDGSTVTAAAAGSAKVVATDPYGHTAQCIVRVYTEISADMIRIYINPCGTNTVYMDEQNIIDFEVVVEAAVPDLTIIWYVMDGRVDPDNCGTNAKFATYILGLTDDIPDIIIGGSGAFGITTDKIPIHEDMPKLKMTAYCATSTSTRYYAGYANMPNAHVPAATRIYNFITSLNETTGQ